MKPDHVNPEETLIPAPEDASKKNKNPLALELKGFFILLKLLTIQNNTGYRFPP